VAGQGQWQYHPQIIEHLIPNPRKHTWKIRIAHSNPTDSSARQSGKGVSKSKDPDVAPIRSKNMYGCCATESKTKRAFSRITSQRLGRTLFDESNSLTQRKTPCEGCWRTLPKRNDLDCPSIDSRTSHVSQCAHAYTSSILHEESSCRT